MHQTIGGLAGLRRNDEAPLQYNGGVFGGRTRLEKAFLVLPSHPKDHGECRANQATKQHREPNADTELDRLADGNKSKVGRRVCVRQESEQAGNEKLLSTWALENRSPRHSSPDIDAIKAAGQPSENKCYVI